MEGPADDPVVSFTSAPELPQEEVLARLLFGRSLDKISPLQAAQLANAVAVLAGRGGVGIVGNLRRKPGGWWAFHYDFEGGAEDDDNAFRLERHRFNPGDYVSIMEDEGAHTYRVVSAEPL